MSWLRRALACAFLVPLGGVAHAEGPPLTVSELVVDPSNEQHLALRSTFGLMLSQDGGKSWDFRCKVGIGQGRAEPALALLNGGTIALGTTNGVMTGDPSGCDFTRAAGISENVTDVIAEPRIKGGALAISASFDNRSSQLWRSDDGGRSFVAVGQRLDHFTALSLGVSAASSTRVYLTGLLWGASVRGAFARSEDGGKTFALTPLEGSDSGTQPFIAAIDPAQPDKLYLRFTGLPGTLRESGDAGRTFHEILSLPGPIQGFSLSPAGDQLFASSLEAGQFVAARDHLSFEKIACTGLPCLAATNDGLLGCGERSRHGFIVGRSSDRGQSFTPLLDTPCLTAPSCAPNTSVGAACAEPWSKLSAQLASSNARCDRAAPTKTLDRSCLDTAAPSAQVTQPTPVAHAAKTQPRPSNSASCKCALGSTPGPSDSRLARLLFWGLAAYVAARRTHGSRRIARVAKAHESGEGSLDRPE